MLLSYLSLTLLAVPALFLKSGVRKVLYNLNPMQVFGLRKCPRLVNPAFTAIYSLDFLQVQLVIILSIDPPNLHLPRITIELWRGFLPTRPIRSPAAQQREGGWVWGADWTHAATPLYILFSDIFRGPAPADYGNHDRVQFDSVGWRQSIIDSY